MAVNKTAGVTKVKLGSAAKKTAVLKKAAPKKAAVSRRRLPRRPSHGCLGSKKAAPKKAAGPKLTAPQHELLKKVVAHKGAKGYHTEKKPEHRCSRLCSSTRW